MSASPLLLERLATETSPAKRPSAIIIDWESGSKHSRQESSEALIGITTNLMHDEPAGVDRARQLGFERVICRINSLGRDTSREVEDVIEQGGTDILLPMWHSIEEVDALRDIVRNRVRIGLMIETASAIENIAHLKDRSISFAFIGLVDLALDRGTSSIFTPLADGTLASVAAALERIPFGFGGLTLPDRGEPIPSRLLVGEMLRLGSHFSVMRRSFFRDVEVSASGNAIEHIRSAIETWSHRSAEEIEIDRRTLVDVVRSLS